MATDVIVLDAVESMAEDIDTTLDEKLDSFIDEATAIVEKLGAGLPPRDMIAFTSQSTDEGIKLTFTPPDVTYFAEHTSGDGKQFACMPAGVLIRYSDVGYPRTPNDGVFGYDYKPTGDWETESHSCTIVGLTKDTKYYFTAFPYSTEHVYNKNQIAVNRTEMTWVGNKGTISVTVNTPEGYQGTLGEYTITLVDQAADNPQNIEQTASGQGLTRFGNLEGGKTYKVRLSTTSDLQAPADSEPITIVGGINYDVTMTYVSRYGTITVNVATNPANMPIGAYTVTLTPQGGGEAKSVQGNNSQAVVFSDVENGKVYTVSLSAINHYTANAGGTVTAVGGQNTQHNANYVFNATLEQCSWNEIEKIAATGNAGNAFGIGSKKSLTKPSGAKVVLVHSRTNRAVFCTDRKMGTSHKSRGWFCWSTNWSSYTEIKRDVDEDYQSWFDNEILEIAKTVSINTSGPEQAQAGEMHSTSVSTSQKFYPPSATEVGFSASSEYGSAFAYFTSNEARKFISGGYSTRSIQVNSYYDQYMVGVSSTGTKSNLKDESVSYPICFEV